MLETSTTSSDSSSPSSFSARSSSMKKCSNMDQLPRIPPRKQWLVQPRRQQQHQFDLSLDHDDGEDARKTEEIISSTMDLLKDRNDTDDDNDNQSLNLQALHMKDSAEEPQPFERANEEDGDGNEEMPSLVSFCDDSLSSYHSMISRESHDDGMPPLIPLEEVDREQQDDDEGDEQEECEGEKDDEGELSPVLVAEKQEEGKPQYQQPSTASGPETPHLKRRSGSILKVQNYTPDVVPRREGRWLEAKSSSDSLPCLTRGIQNNGNHTSIHSSRWDPFSALSRQQLNHASSCTATRAGRKVARHDSMPCYRVLAARRTVQDRQPTL